MGLPFTNPIEAMTMDFVVENSLFAWVLRLAVAILVLLFGWRVAKTVRALTRRGLQQAGLTDSLVALFTAVTFYGILLLVVILALALLGIPITSIVLVLGVIIVILGIALQESLANLSATVLFLLFQPYKVGDTVQTAGVLGIVKEIQIFHTTIMTFDNKLVTAPNGKIQDSNIINYSRLGVLRADVNLQVSYEDDLRQVKQLLLDILAADERVLAEPPPTVVILDFGESGIDVGVRPFVKLDDYWKIQFDLRERIKERFDEAGITIPYPQRDVHLKQAKP
jgi:small conductance mechanosensitive channel